MTESQANQMINILITIEHKISSIAKKLEDKKPKGK